MSKPKTRSPRKVKPMPPETRALYKKANDQRLRQQAKTTLMKVRMAKQFAAAAGISAREIPAALRREMDAAQRAVHGGKRPKLVRLKPSDPQATDPHLINPYGE